MFVIDAPDGQRDLIGSEVLEIGRRTVAALGDAMRPYLSRDNDAFLPFEVAFGLTLPDLLGALGADTNGAKVRLKLRKDKRTITADLAKQEGPLDLEKLPLKLIPPTGGDGPLPDYLTHLDDNFWLKKVDRETVYVQINQCRDQPKKTLGQFASEIDGAIATKKPRNLVVDVRLNNGGDFEATFVIVKSIIVFEKSRPDARLFVIIGRNTLSAAQNFVGLLDQLCEPIFVGEPTGSRPNHAGDDTEVVLPYSGVIGSISCAYHQTNYRDARRWIAPRIPVALSSQAYFARRDPVMEAVSLSIAEHQAGEKGADREPKFPPPPPAEETDAARKLIDEAAAALRSGKSTSDILADPKFLPAHEWPRFRRLIRDQSKSSKVAIVQPKEPGEPLIVSGRVLDKAGQPVKGALVYIYQTSAKGWYSDRAAHVDAHEGDRKHARLFGYMLTDDEGRFELRTIRPAGYPDSDLPAHIHVEVEPPEKKAATLVTEIQFDDDPRLTREWRDRSRKEGFVIAPVAIGSDKTQRLRVELRLRNE